MQWQKYKNLDYLVQSAENANTCVVLFHGYGADAKDLAPLWQAFSFKESVDWFFPQGVEEVPIGPMMSGRAWFQLRVADFEQIAMDRLEDNGITAEVLRTFNLVSDWLNDLAKRYDKVIIGGFSQGAIMVSHCFYRLNFKPDALVLFSGFLIAPSSIPTLSDEQKVPFFQSHGEQDPVLPVSGAQKLHNLLTEKGMQGTWAPFSGGHEIPMTVIQRLQTFLDSL